MMPSQTLHRTPASADPWPRNGLTQRSIVCLHPCCRGVPGCRRLNHTRCTSVSCLALDLATRVERGPTMLCHNAYSWLALPMRLLALSAWLPHRTAQHAASNACTPALPDGKRCAAAAVIDRAARVTDDVARHSHSSGDTLVCTLFAIESTHREPNAQTPLRLLLDVRRGCILQFIR